jgi:hypothetical protein
MKSTLFTLFFAAILLFSCKNSTPEVATPVPAPVIPVAAPIAAPTPKTTCYAMRFKKDITAVQLTITGEDVIGYYAYEPYEKDGGHGSIKGKMNGDIITGQNEFMIEGSIETEEVMFKIAGDKLLQAQGVFDEKLGKFLFTDKTKLTWKETFASTDCATISKQITNCKETAEYILKQKKTK